MPLLVGIHLSAGQISCIDAAKKTFETEHFMINGGPVDDNNLKEKLSVAKTHLGRSEISATYFVLKAHCKSESRKNLLKAAEELGFGKCGIISEDAACCIMSLSKFNIQLNEGQQIAIITKGRPKGILCHYWQKIGRHIKSCQKPFLADNETKVEQLRGYLKNYVDMTLIHESVDKKLFKDIQHRIMDQEHNYWSSAALLKAGMLHWKTFRSTNVLDYIDKNYTLKINGKKFKEFKLPSLPFKTNIAFNAEQNVNQKIEVFEGINKIVVKENIKHAPINIQISIDENGIMALNVGRDLPHRILNIKQAELNTPKINPPASKFTKDSVFPPFKNFLPSQNSYMSPSQILEAKQNKIDAQKIGPAASKSAANVNSLFDDINYEILKDKPLPIFQDFTKPKIPSSNSSLFPPTPPNLRQAEMNKPKISPTASKFPNNVNPCSYGETSFKQELFDRIDNFKQTKTIAPKISIAASKFSNDIKPAEPFPKPRPVEFNKQKISPAASKSPDNVNPRINGETSFKQELFDRVHNLKQTTTKAPNINHVASKSSNEIKPTVPFPKLRQAELNEPKIGPTVSKFPNNVNPHINGETSFKQELFDRIHNFKQTKTIEPKINIATPTNNNFKNFLPLPNSFVSPPKIPQAQQAKPNGPLIRPPAFGLSPPPCQQYSPCKAIHVPQQRGDIFSERENNFVNLQLALWEEAATNELNEAVVEKIETFECLVCFVEYEVDDGRFLCSNWTKGDPNKSHAICRECLQGHAKAVVYDNPIVPEADGIHCVEQGCENVFILANICKYLPYETSEALLKRMQEENVLTVSQDEEFKNALYNCEKCGHCGWIDKSQPTFYCECGEMKCTYCLKVYDKDHEGKSCDEVKATEEKNRINRGIEERINECVVRKCPKCGTQFIKADGCNKMKCRCGTLSCYLCNSMITGYDHFCSCGTANGAIEKGMCFKCNKRCRLFEDANAFDEERIQQIRNNK